MPSIVQFFHPGKEHGDDSVKNQDKYFKNWNTNDHKRKFMINEGSYIDNDIRKEGELLFWGEWEPPSYVEKIDAHKNCSLYGKNPEYLHTPVLPTIDKIEKYQREHCYQNTDPFVFGKSFIYAICRQERIKDLKKLVSGSLILFGSQVNYRFVIDTVFVVKEKMPYFSLDDIKKKNLGIYPEIVTKMILNKEMKVDNSEGLTLYIGATYDNKENGMFSYVPAKVYNNNQEGFPRFFMPDEFYNNNRFSKYFSKWKKNGKIFEGKAMGVNMPYDNVDKDEIYSFWEYIRNEVSKNHVLGFNFKMPEMKDDVPGPPIILKPKLIQQQIKKC
jgi:hypothetical protein